jgi:DNA-binding transcriptional regulator LsrR (DeoR family)
VLPEAGTHDKAKSELCRHAVQYMLPLLRNKMILGITWGTTVRYIPHHMPQTKLKKCGLWGLTANLPASFPSFDGHRILSEFAAKLNAARHSLESPFVVQSRVLRDMLKQEPKIAEHFAMFDRMELGIVGLGSSLPEESPTYTNGNITLEESKELAKQGYCADICGHRLDIEGRPAKTFLSGRVISIPLEALKKMPEVIALAEGKEKAVSIIAAARGGYYKSLITDELAAQAVLKQIGI